MMVDDFIYGSALVIDVYRLILTCAACVIYTISLYDHLLYFYNWFAHNSVEGDVREKTLWMEGAMVPGPIQISSCGPWSQQYFAIYFAQQYFALVPGPDKNLVNGPGPKCNGPWSLGPFGQLSLVPGTPGSRPFN